jgi:hypothetical protein
MWRCTGVGAEAGGFGSGSSLVGVTDLGSGSSIVRVAREEGEGQWRLGLGDAQMGVERWPSAWRARVEEEVDNDLGSG